MNKPNFVGVLLLNVEGVRLPESIDRQQSDFTDSDPGDRFLVFVISRIF